MCDANATNAGVLGTSEGNGPSGESRKAVALAACLGFCLLRLRIPVIAYRMLNISWAKGNNL